MIRGVKENLLGRSVGEVTSAEADLGKNIWELMERAQTRGS